MIALDGIGKDRRPRRRVRIGKRNQILGLASRVLRARNVESECWRSAFSDRRKIITQLPKDQFLFIFSRRHRFSFPSRVPS
jgi:hypothetical protein